MTGWICEECLTARATTVVRLPNGASARLTCERHRRRAALYVLRKWDVESVDFRPIPQPDSPDALSGKPE
jgi:hypothetical protein